MFLGLGIIEGGGNNQPIEGRTKTMLLVHEIIFDEVCKYMYYVRGEGDGLRWQRGWGWRGRKPMGGVAVIVPASFLWQMTTALSKVTAPQDSFVIRRPRRSMPSRCSTWGMRRGGATGEDRST